MQTASGGDNRNVIQAKLASGATVTLEKDCGCCDEIHIGPHWLHMNDFDRDVNRKQMADADRASNAALFLHGMRAEVRRLAEKKRLMLQHGIVEIFRPVLDAAT